MQQVTYFVSTLTGDLELGLVEEIEVRTIFRRTTVENLLAVLLPVGLVDVDTCGR
jgi:hypothetical protein